MASASTKSSCEFGALLIVTFLHRCRMKAKLEAATADAAVLRKSLKEKTMECELLQTASFQARNELTDLANSVCDHCLDFTWPALIDILNMQSNLRIHELESQLREHRSRSDDMEREVEEYRRCGLNVEGWLKESLLK